jgi:hypothetical protein
MITIDSLKKTIAKLGYKWFEDLPNIIGVRSALNAPDVFNDLIFIVYSQNGVEKLFSATITTDPGVTYQVKPMNPNGCAVLPPGQYINDYKSGFHQGKQDHRALIEVGKIQVARDNDKDGIAEIEGKLLEEGYFGVNIHGAMKNTDTTKIGPWSAGCQVHSRWSKKEEMMDIVDRYTHVNKGLVTYTLIEEKDLCQDLKI